MEIKRDIYLNQLVNARQNGFIKVVTGPLRASSMHGGVRGDFSEPVNRSER